MELFRSKKRRSNKTMLPPFPENRSELIWRKTFRQSNTFRGYRRVRLTIYCESGVDETMKALAASGYNLSGSLIQIDHIHVYNQYNSYKFVDVYIDGMRIGCVYSSNSEYYPMLTEYDFDKVFVLVESDYVYLFVHYPGISPIKSSTYVR